MRGVLLSCVGRGPVLPLVAMAVVAVAPSARAQFNGDPFDPFRAAYRSSTIPMATQFGPGGQRVVVPPGMGTVPGIGQPWDASFTTPTYAPRALSRFDRFDDPLLSPSNDAYRRYDEAFGRVYRPNAEADEQFARLQEARNQLYFQARQETDPERRAELLRQYRDLSRRISLGMSATTSRTPSVSRGARPDGAEDRAGRAATPNGLPRTVRSYDDLARWARAINREAAAVGIVRPDPN